MSTDDEDNRKVFTRTKWVSGGVGTAVTLVGALTEASKQGYLAWLPPGAINLVFDGTLWSLIGIPAAVLVDSFGLLGRGSRALKSLVGSRWRTEGYTYYTAFGQPSDFDVIVRAGTISIGQRHVSLERITSLYQVNREILTCVFDTIQRQNLRGYFILYPLKMEICRKILDRTIVISDEIQASGLAKSFRAASGIYIAMAYGDTNRSKGIVVRELLRTLGRFKGRGRLKYVFTRPASIPGEISVAKYGFRPLGPPSLIHKLDINDEVITTLSTKHQN